MKAILSRAAGPAATLTLADVGEPAPGPDDVLIRVKACGVNYLDALIIEDKYQTRPPRPFSPGAEISGVIERVGADVKTLHMGDHVVAWTLWGGLAEKVATNAGRCAVVPPTLPFDIAAALVLTYGTSHHALKDRAHLAAGETLFILGAAGGVGLAAVELGKAMGARVIAACSTQEKVDMARAHGADAGLVYPTGALDKTQAKAFTDAIKALAPDGVDVVYDPIGGYYMEPTIRAIAWGGRYLVVGFAASVPKLPLNLLLLKNASAVGVYFGAMLERDPQAYAACVAGLLALHDAGKIKPRIFARFPLAQAADAIAALNGRKVIGKVVVTINP